MNMASKLMGYATAAQLRTQVHDTLRARVLEEDASAEKAKREGRPFKRKYSMAQLDAPEYIRWTEQRLDDYRDRGLLVTEMQLADIKKGRALQEGDRVRFIGETRREETRSGRGYLRQHGETGRIVQAVKGSDTLHVYTYLPDFPKEALEATGPNALVVQLQVKESTQGYFMLERITKNTKTEAP